MSFSVHGRIKTYMFLKVLRRFKVRNQNSLLGNWSLIDRERIVQIFTLTVLVILGLSILQIYKFLIKMTQTLVKTLKKCKH